MNRVHLDITPPDKGYHKFLRLATVSFVDFAGKE
jgi:hypothetical protein